MHVCFLINGMGGSGGAERSLLELLPYYIERDVRPTVAVLKDRPGDRERTEQTGAAFIRVPGDKLTAWAANFRRLVAEQQPDLVYTSIWDADMVGRYGRIGRRVPLLSSLVNTYKDPTGQEQRREPTLKRRVAELLDQYTGRIWTDHFHAVAPAVKASYVEAYGIRPSKITVVPRGRARARLGEPSPERRAAVRTRLGLSDTASMLVNVGRHETQKDQVTLVETVARLRERFPGVQAVVLGREGGTTALLRRRIAEQDLGAHVRLLGYREDVPDIVAAADVFVFPSLREGAAGSLLEAMALARPVVVSDIPALRDIIEPGEAGLLAEPRESASFAEAAAALLADRARAESYGRAAREQFEHNYSIEGAADGMVALFHKVALR